MDTMQLGIFLKGQGFSDEGIDEYLEHHGVRGQRWGVTRQGVTRAAVVVGGAAAGVLIAKHFGVPMKTVRTAALVVGGASVANTLLKRHGNKKASEIANARKVLFGNK